MLHVMAFPFAEAFLSALGTRDRPDEERLRLVDELLSDAIAPYPLPKSAESWPARVAAALEGEAASPAEALSSIALADLALAHASLAGDALALARLELEVVEPMPRWLARHRPTPQIVDDLRQELREKLLVGAHAGRPKLLEYRGRGPLGAWVRVIAIRAFLDRGRATRDLLHVSDEDALASFVDPSDTPDLAQLRATYATELREAFHAAARRLEPQERAVLRSHAVDALTIDQLGALYQVHRATAARWVQQAKGSLLAFLREELAHRLGRQHEGCDSVVALVRSRIDLSLERVLRDDRDS